MTVYLKYLLNDYDSGGITAALPLGLMQKKFIKSFDFNKHKISSPYFWSYKGKSGVGLLEMESKMRILVPPKNIASFDDYLYFSWLHCHYSNLK